MSAILRLSRCARHAAPVPMRLSYLARHVAHVTLRRPFCAWYVAPLFLPHYTKHDAALCLTTALFAVATACCSQIHGGQMVGRSRRPHCRGVGKNTSWLPYYHQYGKREAGRTPFAMEGARLSHRLFWRCMRRGVQRLGHSPPSFPTWHDPISPPRAEIGRRNPTPAATSRLKVKPRNSLPPLIIYPNP